MATLCCVKISVPLGKTLPTVAGFEVGTDDVTTTAPLSFVGGPPGVTVAEDGLLPPQAVRKKRIAKAAIRMRTSVSRMLERGGLRIESNTSDSRGFIKYLLFVRFVNNCKSRHSCLDVVV